MDTHQLQKFLKDASAQPSHWLSELAAQVGSDAGSKARAERALELFAQFGPQVEEGALIQATRRMRDYEGSELHQHHHTTIELTYIAAAYSQLALAIASLTQPPGNQA